MAPQRAGRSGRELPGLRWRWSHFVQAFEWIAWLKWGWGWCVPWAGWSITGVVVQCQAWSGRCLSGAWGVASSRRSRVTRCSWTLVRCVVSNIWDFVACVAGSWWGFIVFQVASWYRFVARVVFRSWQFIACVVIRSRCLVARVVFRCWDFVASIAGSRWGMVRWVTVWSWGWWASDS